MFVILVTTVPFYGVKEDISTGTGRGQTIKDIVDLEVAHLTIEKKIKRP